MKNGQLEGRSGMIVPCLQNAHHKHHHHHKRHHSEKVTGDSVVNQGEDRKEFLQMESQAMDQRTDTPIGDRDERRYGERRLDHLAGGMQQRAEWTPSYSNPRAGFGGSSNANLGASSNSNLVSNLSMNTSRQRSQSPSSRDNYRRPQSTRYVCECCPFFMLQIVCDLSVLSDAQWMKRMQ